LLLANLLLVNFSLLFFYYMISNLWYENLLIGSYKNDVSPPISGLQLLTCYRKMPISKLTDYIFFTQIFQDFSLVPPISTKGLVYLKWKNQTIRRYREFARLSYKVKSKVFWRVIRVIPSNISKYAEMRRIVFNRICKYMRFVNKKLDEVNSAIIGFVDDSQSFESALQHLYGKMQSHSANAESYHKILNYEN